MLPISKNLFVGSLEDLHQATGEDWARVHACKTPSHQEALGYEKNLPSDHPHYLVYKKDENDLYLNLVDMKREFMPLYTDPIMKAAFKFIKSNLDKGKKVFIHCNKGESRSPSIGLAFIARKGEVRSKSYKEAAQVFKSQIYPPFLPGDGVAAYLNNNWERIMAF